jgi:membrane protein YdbS with pleckstrin-like domain
MKIEIPDRMIVKEGDKEIMTETKVEETIEEKATVVQRIVDGLTDNALALIAVVPAVWMAVNMIALPDWYIAVVGAVIAYYFTK